MRAGDSLLDRARSAIPAVVALATAALALRLVLMIDEHAVDLLFWDQLDFYEVFKGDPNAWEVFRHQLGPHRQGLPFLGTWLLATLSDWNIRADAFYVGLYTLLATAAALWLRRRVLGRFRLSDVAIPLMMLTPAQYGIFIHTPNASHSAGPSFFLMLFCLALTIPDRRWRYGTLVALDFVMIHTGFALFVGALTPLLLGVYAWHDARESGRRAALLPLACLGLSLAWIAVFLVGYETSGGLANVPASSQIPAYLYYVSFMFANALGLKGFGIANAVVGLIVGMAVLAVALRQLQRMLSAGERPPPISLVCFTLTSFTLLYCAATAYGRLFLGMGGSQSTRYVPLVMPAFLGLYLAMSSLRRPSLRVGLAWFAVIAMVAATFPMREREATFMRHLSRGKRVWIETYLETRDILAANAAARVRVYPSLDPKHRIDERLRYLRENRLSFFAER